jgi:hypothetical protein
MLADANQAIFFSPRLDLITIGWKVFVFDLDTITTGKSQRRAPRVVDLNPGTPKDIINAWFSKNFIVVASGGTSETAKWNDLLVDLLVFRTQFVDGHPSGISKLSDGPWIAENAKHYRTTCAIHPSEEFLIVHVCWWFPDPVSLPTTSANTGTKGIFIARLPAMRDADPKTLGWKRVDDQYVQSIFPRWRYAKRGASNSPNCCQNEFF